MAALDGSVINVVLGGLVGARLSLSIMDHRSLASADVDLFGLYDALALRLNRRDATYGALAAMDVRFVDLVAAAADAGASAHAAPGAVQALRLLAQAVGSSGPVLAGRSLASFWASGGLAVGSGGPLWARLPVLPLAVAAARLAAVQLGARVPGGRISLPPSATGSIARIVQAAAPPIDAQLSAVLSLLGITIGDADTWAGGARCGQGALVS